MVVDFIIKTCYVVLQELTSIYEEKKHAYDTASAGMESNMAKLEQVNICTELNKWREFLCGIYLNR